MSHDQRRELTAAGPDAPVLHLDLVGLTDSAGEAEVENMIGAAAGLLAVQDVIDAGVIRDSSRGGFDLAFLFVLRDFGALEPFGTDERYARFLQGHVVPALRQFAGADVRLAGWPPLRRKCGVCVALVADDETYDWEVAEALEAVAAAVGGSVAVGLAAGERQRYRGVLLSFADELASLDLGWASRFQCDVVAGPATWLK
jgi:hypothetical protein